MKPKGNAILYFVGSVLLIVAAIIFVAILDNVRGSDTSDPRVRADATSTVKMSAVIMGVDETQGVVLIDNLQFRSGIKKNLGTWTVTPPAGYSLSRAVVGKKVTLTVDPTTFIATTHTLSATSIK